MTMAKITPQPQAKQLAKALGLNAELRLKREDLHPYGSHKGRSIPIMIKRYADGGHGNFCISSSGNAALAAIYAVKKLNEKEEKKITLRVFVGRHIQEDKLNLLREAGNNLDNISIEQVATPKQTAFQMDKDGKAKNLRQSTDDTALIGYETLANELADIKNLATVFIPTSSGTTAQALHQEFTKLNLNPQIHIVQTESCHPIADVFHLFTIKTASTASIAGAIVDKVARRRDKVAEALKPSKGNAWVCGNKEIKSVMMLAKKTEKITISSNSALAVAGLAQAIKNNWHFNGPVVCILTGR